MRQAKIICTIGPASAAPEVLDRLMQAGMDVARLNFSHGTPESHAQTIWAIREAASRRRRTVAIIQDLQGPRIRVGAVAPEGAVLEVGQPVRFVGGALRSGGQHGFQSQHPGAEISVPVTYPQLARDVRPGARILIDDGLLELRVTSVQGADVLCTTVVGGTLRANKGMNLPGTSVSAPTVTDKDRSDLLFGVGQGVDYIALSFVRGPEDVEAARSVLRSFGASQPIIAKIERAEAIDKLPAILEVADGVMVARGDLGVEMGPETVPILQKQIIEAANKRGKLVITATQMLESMTRNPRPTRAEASDVANAVFDGTDAVMLSAETAAGQYPVEAATVMDQIVCAAEAAMSPRVLRESDRGPGGGTFADAICRAASSASGTIHARAIVALTESGRTARLLSKERPRVPIIALTPNETVERRLALVWGVRTERFPVMEQNDERVQRIDRLLKDQGMAQSGDRIVMVSGAVAGQEGGTNMMKLHEVR